MLIIGMDVGTTGVKAIVINENGDILNSGYQGYPLISKSGDIVEQDATLWYSSACIAVKQALIGLDTADVCALSMSTQGASSLLVDDDFNPLMNAITWMDGRSAKEKDEIIKALGDDYIYQKTGWKAHASLDACKLSWIKKNMKDDYDKSAYFVSTLEYMNGKLTGIGAIDPTNCAMRQLMDIKTLEYDDRILEAVGADKSKIPPILPTGKYLSVLTEKAASDFGLTQKVKVYNGAHDQYCGLYAAKVINDGELTLSTGTAWVTLGVTNKPWYTKSYISPGPHVVKNKYGALASVPVAGAALDWLKDNIIKEDYDSINENIELRMEKCKELLFYPYLSGATFPIWNEQIKGAFLGLTLAHDRYDLALACMEGVAFQLMLALDEYESVNVLKVMGRSTQSKTWMNILSSLSDCDVYIMSQKDTPCVGAALIAAVGEGLDYNELADRMNKSEKLSRASTQVISHYKKKYLRYKKSILKLSDV